ncbi:hypothetical protein HDV00_000033 [Rhizophlyctis rosea]|nr:hypothetical protein HDV00_000033 [Rhizophlyctis rosea]
MNPSNVPGAIALLLATLLIHHVSSEPIPMHLSRRAQSGITLVVKSATNFCAMLPPNPGDTVGNTESISLAYCTSPVDGDAIGARAFPGGFITSAHYVATSGYVQVTGTFDRSKYSLKSSDGGGQYDSAAAGIRPGSSCAGWGSYLEYLEPDSQRYCVRCCADDGEADNSPCNWHHDLDGCNRIGGDYGWYFPIPSYAVTSFLMFALQDVKFLTSMHTGSGFTNSGSTGGGSGGGGGGGGSKKSDWDFCSSNSECANGCCSSVYSNDGRTKCTPGGFQSYCTGSTGTGGGGSSGDGSGSGTGGGSKKSDWDFCSSNSDCSNGCCSNIYSNDGKLKCTPGGFHSYCTGSSEGSSSGSGGGGGGSSSGTKVDWDFCTANSECANRCCSNKYSNDGRLKCTPGGC